MFQVLPGHPTRPPTGLTSEDTDNRSGVREFLISRRAKLTPRQAGLPAWGGNRRVAGLRREEVALLAGVSAEYYARLERGNLGGVSESVLEALARALQLDDAGSSTPAPATSTRTGTNRRIRRWHYSARKPAAIRTTVP